MATIIKLKNSVTTTNAPSSLQQGEVAINVADRKVWVGNAATTPIQLLGEGATGSFTTLSVSGVATFSAGTAALPSITTTGDTNTGIFFPAADTIAFTEGGVESVRINASGNVGIGSTNPTTRLVVDAPTCQITGTSTTGTNSVLLRLNNTGGYFFVGRDNDTGTSFGTPYASLVWSNGAYPMVFGTNDTERMRIDSAGNVLIGTNTNPSSLKLNVNGTTGSTRFLVSSSSSASTPDYSFISDGGLGMFRLPNVLGFSVGGVERMRLDSVGTLGISVVPAAWGGSFPALQVESAALFGIANTSYAGLSANAYIDSSSFANDSKYINTAAASIYLQSSGTHVWYTAPSGTANAAITWTERMSVTNLGVLSFNSGYGSSAPAYGCRAWVNFNGTGTVAIRASGNVSSITDNGTGYYTLNFTTALPNVNYATNITVNGGNANGGTINSQATVSVSIYTWDALNNLLDVGEACVSIHR
jgi:hypothetical protein